MNCLLNNSASSKTITQSEATQQILSYINRLEQLNYDRQEKIGINPYDSILSINNQLNNYLTFLSKKNPEVLSEPLTFPDNSNIKVVTSKDKKLSIYTWDTYTGGSMHYFNSYAVYISNTKIFLQPICVASPRTGEEPPPTGEFYKEIFQFKSKAQTVYLTYGNSILSSNLTSTSVSAYQIKNGSLSSVNIFFKDGKPTSSIVYEYDYKTNYDLMNSRERRQPHIKHNKLFIPTTIEKKMLPAWQVYTYTKGKLVYQKTRM